MLIYEFKKGGKHNRNIHLAATMRLISYRYYQQLVVVPTVDFNNNLAIYFNKQLKLWNPLNPKENIYKSTSIEM